MLELLVSAFWTLSIDVMFFKPQHFKRWFCPRPQVKPTLLGPVDQASLYQWFKKHKGDG
jgi:hypothetical protein